MAGKEEDVKLLGWSESPFVIRVRIALNMLGVRHEYVQEDLANKSPLLLASNPVHKKVPVLIHRGKPICESLLILQYIDQVWGGAAAAPPIFPADPYQRVRALFWAAYIDDKLNPTWLRLINAWTEERRLQMAKAILAAIRTMEGAFAECSNGRAFFAGDSIGLLDIVVGSHLIVLEVLGRMHGVEFIDAIRTPLLAAWAARFRETLAAKDVIPEADRVVKHIKKLQAYLAAARAAKL